MTLSAPLGGAGLLNQYICATWWYRTFESICLTLSAPLGGAGLEATCKGQYLHHLVVQDLKQSDMVKICATWWCSVKNNVIWTVEQNLEQSTLEVFRNSYLVQIGPKV